MRKKVEQEGKTGSVWGLAPVGGGGCKKRVCGRNIMYSYMKMEK
jgi:hypothetical protein